ncbi:MULTISPECIES: LytTR family transcriptional regulator DNA-binding domain-containing protein [Cohnella]|uniref:LytTR family transcriptional regulator DNA-binding domain-containing protein n=1 Tax=Cohnella TaxID=329857 RepID=UPI0009BC3FAA|nr:MULTISPECIES: LytTR family transcriptional regulator DNA-binding domain-containing protein [Cohnella]MBN2983215.1 LytTR family transcriptional regulator DNA-binding domain-containing protein [Cohnella algarum]
MILSVSKDPEAASGFHELPVEEILFIEAPKLKDMVSFHTLTDRFYAPGTLRYWAEGLRASGLDFAMVDRTNAIHLTKVMHVDRRYRIAYFDERKSKSCTISISNVSKVLQYLSV